MELLNGRPLVVISLVSIFLMLVSSRADSIFICVFMTVIIALIGTIIALIRHIRRKDKLLKRIFCIFVFIVVSLTLSLRAFNFNNIKMGSFENLYDQECHVSGEVLEIGYKSTFSEKLYVRLTSINGEKVDIKVVLNVEGESFLSEGDVFSLIGIPQKFDNEERYLIADGNLAKLVCEYPENIEITGNVEDRIFFRFCGLNSKIQDRIYSLIDEKSGALVGAVTLGNKDLLEDNIIRDFRRCGISHVLALSGLHITVIIGFFDILLQKMRVDRRIRIFILAVLGIFYLAITGFSMSAMRAVIMLYMVYIAHLIWADSDSITSLSVATVAILAINPYALTSVSLWMSVIATLGIITLSDIISPLGYKIKKKSIGVQIAYKLLTSVSLTLAAIFFVSVFNWICFGEISVISPLTNLVITPLITLVLVLSLAMLLFSLIFPTASSIIGELIEFLCHCVFDISEHFSNLRNITVSLKYDFVKYIAIPFVIILALFLILRIKHKWTIAFIPAAVVISFIICFNTYINETKGITIATYLQNTSSEIIVITNNDATSICDISTGGYRHFAAAYQIAEENGATEIENIILTHYHNYHPSSLLRLSKKYTVRNVLLPEPDDDEIDIYNSICNAFMRSNTKIVTYRRGYSQYVGEGCSVNVSETYYIKRSKHPMIMISIRTSSDDGQNELLYLSSSIFENPYADYPRKPNYIILGHHGPVIHKAPNLYLIERSRPQILFLADAEKMLSDDLTVEKLENLRDRFNTKIVFNKEIYQFILQ